MHLLYIEVKEVEITHPIMVPKTEFGWDRVKVHRIGARKWIFAFENLPCSHFWADFFRQVCESGVELETPLSGKCAQFDGLWIFWDNIFVEIGLKLEPSRNRTFRQFELNARKPHGLFESLSQRTGRKLRILRQIKWKESPFHPYFMSLYWVSTPNSIWF